MKKGPTIFLQAVLVLIGIGAAAFLLWVPSVEGVNVNRPVFDIYFKDPFVAYAYIGSLSFFAALYQMFKVLTHARRNSLFTPAGVKALRTIKHCALCLIGFVVLGVIFILSQESEDHAGGVAMGVMITFASVIVFTAAAVFERLLQNAVDMKSENDLTV